MRTRKQETFQRGNPSPEKAARISRKGGVQDAFCTECKSWYSSSNRAEVNRHAH